jgi:hypothetical protein
LVPDLGTGDIEGVILYASSGWIARLVRLWFEEEMVNFQVQATGPVGLEVL